MDKYDITQYYKILCMHIKNIIYVKHSEAHTQLSHLKRPD